MMKSVFALLVVAMSLGPPAFAQGREIDRIRNAGTVMTEILNVPDDIPQGLLDKAECVIVLPSVIDLP
jgi:lipid-binding SYLF domain-containing protein